MTLSPLSKLSDLDISQWIAEKISPQPADIESIHNEPQYLVWASFWSSDKQCWTYLPRDMVNDPAMTVMLMQRESFVDLMLIEGQYEANFCASETHSEDCFDFYKSESKSLGRAVAEAWMIANGYQDGQDK